MQQVYLILDLFFKEKRIDHKYFQYLCFLLLIITLVDVEVRAEGTKQLQPNATDNGFIQIFDNNTLTRPFATYNCPVDNRLNIHISTVGEIIYLGFNQPNNDVYYRLKDPLGNVVMGPALLPNAGAGFISTHAQAVAGPNTINAAGYTPLSYVATMTGDYYIEFNPTSATVVTPSKRVFTYFDITVASPALVPVAGRLYSKSWDFQCNSGANQFVADLFIYTNDGVVTRLDFNGIRPFGFVVSSNSTGCTSTGNLVNDRKSQPGNVNYPEYKIFLNDPDNISYPTGAIGSIVAPTTVTGCTPGPYCINVTTDARGSGEALIDLNGSAGYQEGTKDVLITNDVISGVNCIVWDGKDGLGNVIPAGTSVPVYVTYTFGLTNLPLFDAEFHPNGYKVFAVRPAAPTPLLMWDDALVGGTTNLPGCPGTAGCHTWPAQGAGFGNNNTINTWWHINTATDNAIHIVPGLTLATSVVNAQCDGDIPGSVTVIPSGGKAPYTYSWNTLPVQTTATAANLLPGIYSVVVTDACGASKTISATVSVSPRPIVNAGPDATICPSNSTVFLSGTVKYVSGGKWTGGTGVFNPNDTSLNAIYTPSATEISNGFLELVLTSTGNGACPEVSDKMRIDVTAPLSVSITAPAGVCFGQKATLTAVPTGGTSPYTYLWNTDDTTQVLSNQPGGNFSVTVTDATGNACQASASVSIPQNPQLIVNASANNITSCNTTTSISGTASGGTPGYRYSWSNGASGFSINVSSGTYVVTAKDNVGCTALDTVIVNAVNNTLSASINQPAVLCNGATTTITVSPAGGFGDYTYLWSNGSTGFSIVASAGNHCVRVRDGGGCITNACVDVLQNPALSATISNSSPVCNGASTSITAVAGGGRAPYSYVWNTGQTSQSITQSAGSYTVTVTDANACQTTANTTITEATAITASITSSVNSCYGGNDASATVSATGGTGAYNYLWSLGGSNIATATGLYAGVYQVTVTDAQGCSTTWNVTISGPTQLIAIITSSSDVSCTGGNNGSASFSVAGGVPGYAYSWTPAGGTGLTAGGLAAGAYIATVEDSKGCRASADVSISEPTGLSVTVNSTDVSCNGGADGSAVASVSGGTPAYTYLWSAGGTAVNKSGLSTGDYSVQVTDTKGCATIGNVNIGEPPVLTASISTTTIVSCYGGSNGTATVAASGGVTPYSYLWSSGGTNAAETNLAAGNYSVVVTDAKGCSVTINTTITQSPLLVATLAPAAKISCESTIPISASASGGDGNYSYLWSDGLTTTTTYVATTGKYTIYVTDGKGCKAKDTVSVLALNSSLSASVIAPSYICIGATTTISVNVIPGVSPYSYAWNIGEATSSIIAGSGFHCVRVTDNQGCKFEDCVNVQEVPALDISFVADTACYNGTTGIESVISGGHAPYTYSWNTGENSKNILKPEGTYTLTVNDTNACSISKSVSIVQNTEMLISFSTENVICYNGSNGNATINTSGGTAPYTYFWSHNNATAQTLYNLAAGTYTAVVTDAVGCTASANVTITQPGTPLIIATTQTNVLCYADSTGSGGVTVDGGTAPYRYYWWQTQDSVSSINNAPVGVYNLLVTDALGCTAFDTINIQQPSAPLTSIKIKSEVTCFGGNDGSASIAVSGGIGPYSYAWSNGAFDSLASGLVAGQYTVTVTDANSCKLKDTVVISQPPLLTGIVQITDVSCPGGNNGAASIVVSGGAVPYKYKWLPIVNTSAAASSLLAGVYVVSITDSNKCVLKDSITISEPLPLLANVSKTNVSCFGGNNGSITTSASGGTSPYTYIWNPGANTTASISGVSVGSYTVTIKDSFNCLTSATTVVTQPATTLSAIITDIGSVSCAGGDDGSAVVKVDGGTPGFAYAWSPSGGTGPKGIDFSAGSYSVTVTDTNGCTASNTVLIFQPDSLIPIAVINKNVGCEGGADGSATVNISGGTSGYSILWSPAGGTNATANGLTAGNYSVSVTDAKGCSANGNVTIAEPPALQLTSNSNNVSCNGAKDGNIITTVTGGARPYTYLWSTGVTDSSLKNIQGDIYYITVTDTNGCILLRKFTIVEPLLLSLNINTSNVKCNGEKNGTALVQVTGGTAPYTYNWSFSSDKDSLASGIDTGTHSVIIKDINGCSQTKQFFISEPAILKTTLSKTNAKCYRSKDGVAWVSIDGGTGPYGYLWSQGGGTDSVITGLQSGLYTVLVTDENGCFQTGTINIEQPDTILTEVSKDTLICIGQQVSLSSFASGGIPGYTFTWNRGLGTGAVQNVKPIMTVTYTVTTSDSNNCKGAPVSVTVNVNPPLSVEVTPSDTICFGETTSVAVLKVSGGDGKYSYSWSHNLANSPGPLNSTPDSSTTYAVTVSDGCGTPIVQDLSTVVVVQKPMGEILPYPDRGCAPFTVQFNTHNTSNTGLKYRWDIEGVAFDSVPNPTYRFDIPGQYKIKLTLTNSVCSATAVGDTTILVWPKPVALFDATPKDVSILGPQVTFLDRSSADVNSWRWDFGDAYASLDSNPTHLYLEPGTYHPRLIVRNQYNCIDTVYNTVIIRPDFAFYVPNSFTPNGDRNNDSFSGYGIGITRYKMDIFDRWGNHFYTTDDIEKPWDGKIAGEMAVTDVYVYLITVWDYAGHTHEYVGHVSLIK